LHIALITGKLNMYNTYGTLSMFYFSQVLYIFLIKCSLKVCRMWKKGIKLLATRVVVWLVKVGWRTPHTEACGAKTCSYRRWEKKCKSDAWQQVSNTTHYPWVQERHERSFFFLKKDRKEIWNDAWDHSGHDRALYIFF